MHLSMFSPRVGGQATHGNLASLWSPWVGTLKTSFPEGGEFDLVAILENVKRPGNEWFLGSANTIRGLG